MVLRRSLPSSLFASLLLSAACSASLADPAMAGPSALRSHVALAIAAPRVRAPYDVQILRDDGSALPTYALRDRFYVEGSAEERYTIRIVNPTARRVEAVVTVDGLDVIDGENGDLRKRGYIVPAYGETRIDGFRTSLSDVATFRFSSVEDSYAGEKGKARNVGVIAVALFEEHAVDAPVIVGSSAPRPRRPVPYGPRREASRAGAGDSAPPAPPATANASAPRQAKAAEAEAAPSAGASAGGYADDSRESSTDRAGLGTEFGEQRSSAVSYTSFVRAPGRPVAIAELRYNDAAGLVALGIPVRPMPDDDELWTRETADPFPGDHFARPAR